MLTTQNRYRNFFLVVKQPGLQLYLNFPVLFDGKVINQALELHLYCTGVNLHGMLNEQVYLSVSLYIQSNSVITSWKRISTLWRYNRGVWLTVRNCYDNIWRCRGGVAWTDVGITGFYFIYSVLLDFILRRSTGYPDRLYLFLVFLSPSRGIKLLCKKVTIVFFHIFSYSPFIIICPSHSPLVKPPLQLDRIQ